MSKKKRVLVSLSVIMILCFFTIMLGGASCIPGKGVSCGGLWSLGVEDIPEEECYDLYKEVENMQGNYSDENQMTEDFCTEVDKRVLASGGAQLEKEYKELEGKHKYEKGYDLTEKELYSKYKDLYQKVWAEMTQELTQYKKLLSVIQGTWTRVPDKSPYKFSWDDNGPQITLSIVGNHQVQLVRPIIDEVYEGRKLTDIAVVSQATDQYTCSMGEPSTDSRYVGKPSMVLSQGGKDILEIWLNEDNTITVNSNVKRSELEQLLGKHTVDNLFLHETYSKVQ